MYAVIKTGGKQYRVKAGDVLVVEKLEGDVGSVGGPADREPVGIDVAPHRSVLELAEDDGHVGGLMGEIPPIEAEPLGRVGQRERG